MRFFVFICLSLVLSTKVHAQFQADKQKAFKAQIGLASAWVSYEYQLYNSITARWELGLGIPNLKTNPTSLGEYYTPGLNFQTRWYFLNSNWKRTDKTNLEFTGTFLSLGVTQKTWHPSEGSKYATVHLAPQIGYSGSINSRINYEFSIGPGFRYNSSSTTWNFAPKSTIRFGYTF